MSETISIKPKCSCTIIRKTPSKEKKKMSPISDLKDHAPGQWVRDQFIAVRPDVRKAIEAAAKITDKKKLKNGISIDLDKNGTVEKRERFYDFDGDGVIGNVKDFAEYYRRNRKTFNAIPFFKAAWKMDPDNMRPTLPIHDMLSLLCRDGNATLDDVKRIYGTLNGVISDARLYFAIPHPSTLDVDSSRNLEIFAGEQLFSYINDAIKRGNRTWLQSLDSPITFNATGGELTFFDGALLATSTAQQLGVSYTIARQGHHFIHITSSKDLEGKDATRYLAAMQYDTARVRELGPRQMLSALYERLARSAYWEQDRDLDAFDYANVAEKLDPKNAANALLQARIARTLDMPNEPTSKAHRALEIDPGYAEPHYYLGNFFLNLSGYEDPALVHLRQAREIAPYDWRPHHKIGTAYYQLKKYEKAIDHYQRAFDLAPNQTFIHRNLAYAFAQKGDHKRALAHAQRAVKAQPNSSGSHFAHGWVLHNKGRHSQALKEYSKAFNLDSSGEGTLYNMGLCYQGMGMNEKAIEIFKKYIAMKGGDLKGALESIGNGASKKFLRKVLKGSFDGVKQIAWCRYKQGHLREAVDLARIVKKGLGLDGDMENHKLALWVGGAAAYRLAMKEKRWGDLVSADSFLELAVQYYKHDAWLHRIRAHALYEALIAKEYLDPMFDQVPDESAAEHVHSILKDALDFKHKPADRALLYLQLGLTQGFMDKKDAHRDAIINLNRALRLNPRHTEAYAGIARAYRKLKMHSQAIHYYRQALARIPRTEKVLRMKTHKELANLLMKLKRNAEADMQLKRAAAE